MASLNDKGQDFKKLARLYQVEVNQRQRLQSRIRELEREIQRLKRENHSINSELRTALQKLQIIMSNPMWDDSQ